MRYIPRKLLIHSAEIFTPISEDSFGNIVYSDGVRVEYVRIDSTEAVGFNGMKKSDGYSAVMIYDIKNSRPQNFKFTTGQKVVFDGYTAFVVSVSEFYEKTGLHHIEIGLG